jgi:signal transduction histidine kinase
MLAASAAATGFLLLEFYRQSANAQVGRAEEVVSRACREIGDHYALFSAGRRGAATPAAADTELAGVVRAALAHAPGVEGGIWRHGDGSLAYAFPTYEGTGPKTDVPTAELEAIRQINADALHGGLPITIRQVGRSQVLAINACPLRGASNGMTAWAMTRVFTGQGPAYNQLLVGLAILALTVLGSAVWLGRILYGWSRKLVGLQTALAARDAQSADLPQLPFTGDRELDRLVHALNATGVRLADERRRAGAAERLAAVGRLAAGLAHEIRNPIAAMRLKAENALAVDDKERPVVALQFILQQIARLDGLLRDLLAMTQRREPKLTENDLAAFLERAADAYRELAASKGVKLVVGPAPPGATPPLFDAEQMHRALDNLILNAIESTPAGGTIDVQAKRRTNALQICVSDSGPGVPPDLRERLFEPFVTGRSDGTGLGLAAVRDIARAHGGDARLVPTSRGAQFEIEVPWPKS